MNAGVPVLNSKTVTNFDDAKKASRGAELILLLSE